jgi:KUP system potassium uptake protein
MTRDGTRAPSGPALGLLTLGALGVVFGDLGTSPLYALQECFTGPYPVTASPDNVRGAVSLFIWALVIIVSVKYVSIIMRADNQGEGGILALLAMALNREQGPAAARRRNHVILLLGFLGAALLYGDGIITPSISVLSAVEGLELITPAFREWVIPISVIILVGLFTLQRVGSGRIGLMFGVVLATWFVSIAVIGFSNLHAYGTDIVWSLDPRWGMRFFRTHGLRGIPVLGAVVLCLTGVEALYADMGHFGRTSIRLAWFGLVLPALAISYLGQGALLLARPAAATRPFFQAVPPAFLPLMVALATAATVVASQALIAAAFSMTQQAAQLGYLPRTRVSHTSHEQIGQIYLPGLNWALMIACLVLVVTFRSSGALAAAFGLAVAGTMAITTILFAVVAYRRWHWSMPAVVALGGTLLAADAAFLVANVLKIASGGWLPLLIAGAVFAVMTTWTRGRGLLRAEYEARAISAEEFIAAIGQSSPHRIRGVAVFMQATSDDVPVSLLHNLKHNQVLHETVILLTVQTERVPHVDAVGRLDVVDLGRGFWRIVGHYGYMEAPSVPELIRESATRGVPVGPAEPSYYLSRETIIASPKPGMALWRERLFGVMVRNATTASAHFGLTPNRVVELGAQVEI